jgi:hypothetical protein
MVMLPGGMALESTACILICPAWRVMSSGVSSRTPRGAVASPSHAGVSAWHMLHREITTSSAWANSTGWAALAALATASALGPSALSQMMAATPATATPQVHHGVGLPA